MEMYQVGGYQFDSVVDGEGLRQVVYLSGCTHNCEGCHGDYMQDPSYGKNISLEEIISTIEDNVMIKDNVNVTLSGGDPMQQNILPLLKVMKSKGWNIWVYTGYEYHEMKNRDELNYIDTIVCGKYIKDLPAMKFAGSSNQRVIKLTGFAYGEIEREYKYDWTAADKNTTVVFAYADDNQGLKMIKSILKGDE